MSGRCDLAVLGAGPAGAAAAIEARRRGLRVVVLDEAAEAGGQVHRAPLPGSTSADADAVAGDSLRRELAASGAECRFGRRVWLVERGFALYAAGPKGSERVESDRLIVAAGAVERHVPVPGWTLPGTVGLAAATILLKAQGVLPGRRVVVAGAGPLLPLVAAKILAAGGEVAAVVDAAGTGDWLRALATGRAPAPTLRGARWVAELAARRVPTFRRHALRRIEGADRVAAAVIAPLGGGPERRIACDAVCVGFGLRPATEVAALLGASHRFDADLGTWRPQLDDHGATDIPGLYLAGDGAGVLGALAAPVQGRIAALAVARDLGRIDAAEHAREHRRLRRSLGAAGRFGAAMSRLSKPPHELLAAMPADTVVCRCESVDRRALDDAVRSGARTLADLKAVTRCGMGPCGGRVCEDAVAELLALATGVSRAAVGRGTVRAPLRPVPLDQAAADLAYEDLPIPEPAPL